MTDQKIITDMLALFDDIDRQTNKFAKQTGLKCQKGCGACCSNPDVETTVAEVLPLAVHLWESAHADGSRGPSVESILESIRSKSSKGICVFFQPDPAIKGHGRCSIYAYRPGLCRLFGFSAIKNKHGKPELVTCKVIKDNQAQVCQRTREELQKGMEVPLLSTHAFRVSNIDPVDGLKLLPINQAIGSALEKIGYNIQNLKQ